MTPSALAGLVVLTAMTLMLTVGLVVGLAVVIALGVALIQLSQAVGEGLEDLAETHREREKVKKGEWQRVAEGFGWSRGAGYTMVGTFDDHKVTLRHGGTSDAPHTSVTLARPAPRMKLKRGVLRWLSSDERTGDEDFDQAYDVTVSPDARPWLGRTLRRRLRQAEVDLHTSKDGVQLRSPGRASLDEMEGLVELATEIFALLPEGELSARRRALACDPAEPPHLRARCVDDLHQAGERVPDGLTDDPAPRVRLAAGRATCDAPTLLALATDATVLDDVRLGATEALAELGAARTGEALRSLTDSDDRKLWFRACRIAQQHQVPGTTAALTALHARGRLDGPDSWRERLAQAMTVALRKQEDDAAEPTLLALLGDERGQVSRYAAEALATCGTVAAVPALQARHDALGVLSTERPVLNAAIRRIQARTSGEAGGLMIADAVPEAGAVSVADRQEKGRLAMAARAKE